MSQRLRLPSIPRISINKSAGKEKVDIEYNGLKVCIMYSLHPGYGYGASKMAQQDQTDEKLREFINSGKVIIKQNERLENKLYRFFFCELKETKGLDLQRDYFMKKQQHMTDTRDIQRIDPSQPLELETAIDTMLQHAKWFDDNGRADLTQRIYNNMQKVFYNQGP